MYKAAINWRHSGLSVYCGKAIWPHNEEGLENLARYIIGASFSLERMSYKAADAVRNAIPHSKVYGWPKFFKLYIVKINGEK